MDKLYPDKSKLRLRLLTYLEEAPKKCFFSVLNYYAAKESQGVSLMNSKEVKAMMLMYEEQVVKNKIDFEIFKENYIEDGYRRDRV